MRGRDAIAVAFRHPDGHIVWESESLNKGPHGWRFAKAPFLRGLIVLYETLVVGTRWLIRSANIQASAEGVELGKGSVALMLGLTLALGIGVFFLLPLFVATFTTGGVQQDWVQHTVEGLVRVGIFLALPRADLAHAGHPARVRVPRRGAHDDPRARGGRPAHDRRRAQVPDGAPALRHRVPRRRDHPVDLRVQPRRAAEHRDHGREPAPARAGDRGDRLRDPPVRRAPPRQPARQGAHGARASSSR